MSQHKEPTRLLDPRADADPLLREALSVVSRDVPTRAQVEALAESATHAVLGAQGVVQNAGWSAGKGLLVKLGGVLLLGSSLLIWRSTAQPKRDVQSSAPQTSGATVGAQPQPTNQTSASAKHVASAREPLGQPVISPLDAALLPLQTPNAQPANDRVATAENSVHETSGSALLGASNAPATTSVQPAARRSAATHERSGGEGRAAGKQTTLVHQRAPVSRSASQPQPDSEREATTSELSLIAGAQQLLLKSPRQALALLEEHRKLYAHGTLAEERDALSLDAYARLGMSEQLVSQARAFLQRYPKSLHRERVELLLRR